MQIVLENAKTDAAKKAAEFILNQNDGVELELMVERIVSLLINESISIDSYYFEYQEMFDQVSFCLEKGLKNIMFIMENGMLIKIHSRDENGNRSFQNVDSPSDDVILQILKNSL